MTTIIDNNEIDEMDPDRLFLSGYCAEFATQLHQHTGLPLVILGYAIEIDEAQRDGDDFYDQFAIEPCHVAVAINDRYIMDVRGVIELDEVEQSAWLGQYPVAYPDEAFPVVIPVGDDIECLESFMGINVPEALEIAQKAVDDSFIKIAENFAPEREDLSIAKIDFENQVFTTVMGIKTIELCADIKETKPSHATALEI